MFVIIFQGYIKGSIRGQTEKLASYIWLSKLSNNQMHSSVFACLQSYCQT